MKKALILILALLLLVSAFSACGAEEQPDMSDSAAPSASGGTPDNSGDIAEVTEIDFWIPDFGTDITDWEDVEAAINAISEEEIGVHVNLSYLSVDSYGTQLSLAVSNREPVDLALYTPVDSSAWINFYSNGCILDMSGLLDTCGQDIKALFGDTLLRVNSVDGAIYGLSNYRQLNSNTYLCYRTDVLEEAGVLELFDTMTTWNEFETVLQAITENCAGIYAIGGGGDQPVTSGKCVWGTGSFSDGHAWDALGDTLNIIYTDQEGGVSNAFNQQELVDTFKMVADWNTRGYIYPDSSISQEASEVLIMQKIYAGSCVDSEYGVEANKKQTCGTDMSCREIIPGRVSTDEMRKLGTFIDRKSVV